MDFRRRALNSLLEAAVPATTWELSLQQDIPKDPYSFSMFSNAFKVLESEGLAKKQNNEWKLARAVVPADLYNLKW